MLGKGDSNSVGNDDRIYAVVGIAEIEGNGAGKVIVLIESADDTDLVRLKYNLRDPKNYQKLPKNTSIIGGTQITYEINPQNNQPRAANGELFKTIKRF